ncbi:hypothetical protein FQN60_009026 [Etheostoma spectabile]|uniref:Uncharacterized protein n=1 Tax=Etheostoma spectabile TaxID=54343 RepID=A0A5J5CNU6_9PERO|nr:hypothetical protein FQN60_009026 [Etheostoma spectabile]
MGTLKARPLDCLCSSAQPAHSCSVTWFSLGRLPRQAQCCSSSVAAVYESIHSSHVQPSSTVCDPAPAPVWRSPLQQGLAVPLQHRLCQDDCIRPVRRFPVNDLPYKVLAGAFVAVRVQVDGARRSLGQKLLPDLLRPGGHFLERPPLQILHC